MATLDDLFNSNGPKVASVFDKLNNPNDTVVGVIVTEPKVTPEMDFKARKPKFMVQVDEDSKWGPKVEGEFDPDTVANSFPLTQFEFDVKTEAGEVYRHRIGGDRKDLLKAAMMEAGLPLEPGVTFAVRLIEKKGQRRLLAYKLAQ